MPRIKFALIIIGFIFAGLFIANCGTPLPTPSNGRTAAARESKSQMIETSVSGTIEFSDGAKVSFPAGAVSQETNVEVAKPKNAADLESGFAGYMRIVPENLSLSNDATVVLKYDTSKIPDPSIVNVLSHSESNPAIDLGSEISYFQFITPESINSQEGTVTFKTNHFSVFGYFWENPAYLVMDLPGKYLKKVI
jgi:hypothetical protein